MSLAEGVQARIARKFYASGVITPGSEPTPSSSPGASGAQVLRRVGSTLSLAKDTYQSSEVRTDRQITDFRHGTRRVTGNITGELSPLTYADEFEALFRGTWGSGVTLGPSDVTSITCDNSTAKVTLGSGDPIALGLRVGDIIRFTGLADADNNSKNFLVLAFGGTGNRDLTVYPAPDTMSPDTSFSLVAKPRLIIPSTGFVSRLAAYEIYNEDIDVARLFTECRVGSCRLQLPASGMTTVEFGLMGRNQWNYEATNAPFFTSPTDATTTGVTAAVNGLLRVGGATQAVVTGIDLTIDLSPSSEAVVGTDLVPEIFLGRANVTGQFTAFFDSLDLINNFIDEDEIELLVKLDSSSAAAAQAISIYLPRIKLGDASVATQGEGGQVVTFPFQALKYQGSAAGVDQTTIAMVDTEVT